MPFAPQFPDTPEMRDRLVKHVLREEVNNRLQASNQLAVGGLGVLIGVLLLVNAVMRTAPVLANSAAILACYIGWCLIAQPLQKLANQQSYEQGKLSTIWTDLTLLFSSPCMLFLYMLTVVWELIRKPFAKKASPSE